MNFILLQVWRPILNTFIEFFGKEPDFLLEYDEISIKDYPQIIKNFYDSLSQTKENHIVLSGPVSLNFVIWQTVWLNHFKIQLYQRNHDTMNYDILSSIDRKIIL